ncbi:hypothetical protein AB0H45_34605 [Streptomyces atroolivaceus]|uniref:hypothetical protein n=1 Tax=Streptomyces atroolivaceus TaxID=66869 RepID=UPI0033D879B9
MSLLRIVGVHGIRQGASATTEELSHDWRAALISTPALPGASAPVWSRHDGMVVTVPSYRDVFPKTVTRFVRLGPQDADGVPMDEEEEAFVLDALAAYAPEAVAAEASLDTSFEGTLGEEQLTPRVARRKRAVDQVAGKGVTDRLLWFVREAHTYIHKPETATAVRATVRKTLVETEATVVLAHSLGSVVFYDMLSRGEIPVKADGHPVVTTLVTLGSPLRWLAVRKGVHTPGEPLGVAAGVRWTNLYSPLDVVPRGKGLADLADGVTDVVAHNGALNPHNVERYLGKPIIAECLRRARTA